MNWTAALGYSLLLYLLQIISGVPIGMVIATTGLEPHVNPTWLVTTTYITNASIYLLFFVYIAKKYPKHILRTCFSIGLITINVSAAISYITFNYFNPWIQHISA